MTKHFPLLNNRSLWNKHFLVLNFHCKWFYFPKRKTISVVRNDSKKVKSAGINVLMQINIGFAVSYKLILNISTKKTDVSLFSWSRTSIRSTHWKTLLLLFQVSRYCYCIWSCYTVWDTIYQFYSQTSKNQVNENIYLNLNKTLPYRFPVL